MMIDAPIPSPAPAAAAPLAPGGDGLDAQLGAFDRRPADQGGFDAALAAAAAENPADEPEARDPEATLAAHLDAMRAAADLVAATLAAGVDPKDVAIVIRTGPATADAAGPIAASDVAIPTPSTPEDALTPAAAWPGSAGPEPAAGPLADTPSGAETAAPSAAEEGLDGTIGPDPRRAGPVAPAPLDPIAPHDVASDPAIAPRDGAPAPTAATPTADAPRSPVPEIAPAIATDPFASRPNAAGSAPPSQQAPNGVAASLGAAGVAAQDLAAPGLASPGLGAAERVASGANALGRVVVDAAAPTSAERAAAPPSPNKSAAATTQLLDAAQRASAAPSAAAAATPSRVASGKSSAAPAIAPSTTTQKAMPAGAENALGAIARNPIDVATLAQAQNAAAQAQQGVFAIDASPSDAPPAIDAVPAPVDAAIDPTAANAQTGLPSVERAASVRAADAAPPPPPAPTAAAQAERAIVEMAAQGERAMRVALHPAELGSIDVLVELSADGRLNAQLSVERPETLELLRRDAGQLLAALERAGVDVAGGFSMDLKRDGSETARDAERERIEGGAPNDDEPIATNQRRLAPRGLVDLVA